MSLCLLAQRISKHLGHNSSAHFSGQSINLMLVLSVLSNLPKGQVELKVRQGKQKTRLPTGQVHLNLLSCLAYLHLYVLYLPQICSRKWGIALDSLQPCLNSGIPHKPWIQFISMGLKALLCCCNYLSKEEEKNMPKLYEFCFIATQICEYRLTDIFVCVYHTYYTWYRKDKRVCWGTEYLE